MKNVAEIVNAKGGLDLLRIAPIRVETEGFMPLVVEHAGTGPRGLAMISVAHYFLQNGDLVPDPDVEVEVEPTSDGTLPADPAAWHPVSITHGATGEFARACWVDESGRVMVSERQVKGIRQFLRAWDRNIKLQGFVDSARAK